MKNLELVEFREMSSQEMKNIEGGNFLLGALSGAFLCELIFEGPKSCFNSFMEGYKSTF